VDHHYRPSAVVQVREDEVAAVVAVVGRMAAVEVAVEAQAEQSLADIVNSHSPLWVQMPVSRALMSTKDTIGARRKRKNSTVLRPRESFSQECYCIFNGEWKTEEYGNQRDVVNDIPRGRPGHHERS
jgi:hypothetical protein